MKVFFIVLFIGSSLIGIAQAKKEKDPLNILQPIIDSAVDTSKYPEWLFITSTKGGEKYYMNTKFFDTGYISSSIGERIFKTWFKITHKTLKYKDKLYLNAYQVVSYRIYPESKLLSEGHYILYSSDGNILDEKNGDSDFQELVPSTIGIDIFENIKWFGDLSISIHNRNRRKQLNY